MKKEDTLIEKLNYVIEDSTIAKLLGVQNFSTDEAAILELIKNAYDAKALKLILDFSNNRLEITDNGVGMDSDDIKRYWMHIGKSNKVYEITDANNRKRIQAGSKGIGRFALARLGENVTIYSQKYNSKGIIWKTDWNSSTLENSVSLKSIGTKIIINNLREKWGKNRVKSLCSYLERVYNDTSMIIEVITEDFTEKVKEHFPKAKVGINCRSNIVLSYDNGLLTTTVISDEFEKEAEKYCPNINLKQFSVTTDMEAELKGNSVIQFIEADLKEKLFKLGTFSANFYFNLNATLMDKEKFMYKYLNTPESLDSGIILYRNAFSISSYEGEKDWLGFGKRFRKSPAAASHGSGSWRVRENQISGYVMIDKEKNKVLKDLSNRQGLDENIYYQLFIAIILTGIKEFERYRQDIIRHINAKNDNEKNESTPVSDKVIKKPSSVKVLTKNETKQLVQEIKSYKQKDNQYKKDKAEVESKYKYDVRILNVLSTIGLKASSIAHEMKNAQNVLNYNYDNIINALKEYNMWETLNYPENTKKAYKNVPGMLKSNQEVEKKLIVFMNTMLSDIEKKKFERKRQNVMDILESLKYEWERDYAWITIEIVTSGDVVYKIAEDMVQVIFDNLILNSTQQNESLQHLNIKIEIKKSNELLKFIYSDTGKGLDKKYKQNPKKILEVHETTRQNGHGLGMWIVNNTIIMSGGEIQNIQGEGNFLCEFTMGGNA